MNYDGPTVRPSPQALAADVPAGEDMAPRRLVLTSWELSLAQVGVDCLERAVESLSPERLGTWFGECRAVRELAEVRTCQRIVVLALTEGNEAIGWLDEGLSSFGAWKRSTDREAVHRLFRIAAGLESLAQGEREVREQVRGAASSVRSRHPYPVLHRILLDAAAAAGKPNDDGAASVADVASDWLRARLTAPGASVLVIGAGRVGRRVAERLQRAAQVTIAYHRRPPDPSWAMRWNVRTIALNEFRPALAQTDALVAAAKASGRLVSIDDFTKHGEGRLRFVVDLGMPRNVDPRIRSRTGTEVVDLSGLPKVLWTEGLLGPSERRIALAADESSDSLAKAAIEPWVRALRQYAEAIRTAEFDQALGYSGDLSPAARLAFERMSERLVSRLLAGTTNEMRAIPPAPDHDARRQRLLDRFRGLGRT